MISNDVKGKFMRKNKSLSKLIISSSIVVLMTSEAMATKNLCIANYQFSNKQDVEVKQLIGKYKSLEQKIYWKSYVEDLYDVTQLIHKNHQDKNIADGSPKRNFDLFGTDNYKAFVQARDYINSIAEGRLTLSPELIKQVHLRSAENLEKDLSPLQKIFSFWFVKPGEYKKRNNRGEDPLFNPLTEEQFIVLKGNPYTKFVELPWPLSRENKRRGYIIYGNKNNVEKDIQDLCNWANDLIPGIKTGKVDPIRLAAEFQWRYVSIHPMVDGNGRTSMLLANRILEEADLPPIMMTFEGYDIYYSPKVWAEKVRTSVLDFEKMIDEPQFKAYIDKETPNLFRTNFVDGPRLALTAKSYRGADKKQKLNKMNEKFEDRWKLIKRELFAATEADEVVIGKQRFVAMQDGFFYNKHGIPHAIHIEQVNGEKVAKLYPLTEQTALLYSMGGKVVDKRFFHRGMNDFMKQHFREFFKFMKEYRDNVKENPTLADNVEIVDYSIIQEANKKGEVYLHEWQLPLLKESLNIKDENPYAVLAQTRGYQTLFEKSFHFGDQTKLHEVLAQYQTMDLKYYKYQEFAEKRNLSEEVQVIVESRRKLFEAAKSILGGKVQELQKALTETPEKFPSTQEWNFFMEYYKNSPMKYGSFEEYRKSSDADSITLIRADQGLSRYIGFLSNSFFREIVDKVPADETIKSVINKLDLALKAKSPTEEQKALLENSIILKIWKARVVGAPRMISNLNRVLQMSKFDTRGMAKEFDREFFEQHLHAINDPFKTNISFSTNTSIYIRSKKATTEAETVDGKVVEGESQDSKEIIPFTFDAEDSKVYFVRMKKSDVTTNEASKYFRQFEVLKPKIALPFNITSSFGIDFFKSDKPEPTDKEEIKRLSEFENSLTAMEINPNKAKK